MLKSIYAIFILLFIVSCNSSDSKNTLFLKIKKLEFNRISDPKMWREIQSEDQFNSVKYTFVNSIGKTRQVKLLPVLKDILVNIQDDSLLRRCIFAIGQMGSEEAEQTLLKLPFSQLSLHNKKAVINSLRYCATERTIKFYEKIASEIKLRSEILVNAAICSRNKLDVSFIKNDLADSLAILNPDKPLSYFLYYTGNMNDVDKIIRIAGKSKGLTQKYALKKLKDLSLENINRFNSYLSADSVLKLKLKTVLINTLRSANSWELKYYAIPTAAVLKDSVLTQEIKRITRSDNNNLSLTALRYLAEADKELAISALLTQFGQDKNMYMRGEIIKILAEYFPDKAYSFVMQNLDKGNSFFRAQLLDALAAIKSRMALRTLKQFINVDDPVLMCRAFDNLRRLGYLNNDDIDHVLNADYACCVQSALDYLLEKNKKQSTEKLISIYKKFNKVDEFGIQFDIIEITRNGLCSPSPIPVDTLNEYASHYVVYKKIYESLAGTLKTAEQIDIPTFTHNQHLIPDSIRYYTKNPLIEIQTNRGNIKIELYPSYAPYTVNSFLKLIKNNFYNNLIFHRVIPDFVIQGGDPTGTGCGGANYLIPS
ncbi:MAG: peptidylprolyl isomerase, partial [Calditrichaceae bacterium]